MATRRDVFGEIAGNRTAVRSTELHLPEPAAVPKTRLPYAADPTTVRLVKPDRPETGAGLRTALAEAKRRASRLLENHAPELPAIRRVSELDTFDWRIETAEDRANAIGLLSGAGDWTEVHIPHYGEPIGKAATYYRTCFEPPAHGPNERLYLRFDAVDYKAHVFINGYYLGSHEGFFAPFEFDVTRYLVDGPNTLVVRVENDYICLGNDDPPAADGTPGKEYQGDKLYAATGLGYDDPMHGWHHCPPGMGICQRVFLETRRDIHVSDLFVRPLLADDAAEIWIEVQNCGLEDRSISIDYSIYGRNFEAIVVEHGRHAPSIREQHGSGDVDRGEAKEIALAMGPGVNYVRFQVPIPSPRRWSPEEPWLYQLQVAAIDEAGNVADASEIQFGMRSFTLDEAGDPAGTLRLNGRRIKLRGANTMGNFQQDVFTGNFDQLVDDILLAKLCNMNFLRLTQRPVQHEIYDYCDRLGLMTQTDLPLFGVLRRNQFSEAARQAGEMERLVRTHPCNIAVSYINEAFPNGRNQPHRHLQRHELDAWIEAANRTVGLHNPDRVIKPHDGDYDPPEPGLPDHHCYCGWYNGHGLGIGKLHRGYWQQVKRGWYYGCGEFGAEGLDPAPLMRRRYPAAWLPSAGEDESTWSPNRIIKSQTGRYHYMWFDTQRTVEDWVAASHEHQALVTRLMTEAFRRDPRMVSFAIHLFIDAFPSGWMKAIMDVDRNPKSAYFAYRNACEPVMISLRTDRFAVASGEEVSVEVWVANDLDEPVEGAVVSWTAKHGDLLIAAGTAGVTAAAWSASCIGNIVFDAPETAERGEITIEASLASPARAAHDASRVTISLFGPTELDTDRCIALPGRADGPAGRLAAELGVNRIIGGDIADGETVILLDRMATYEANRSLVDRAVEAGATAIFLELESGTHRISDTEVEIRPTGMSQFYFASRDTGHRLVEGFAPKDFYLWYDPARDYIAPILATTIRAPGWETILASGVVSWGTDGGPAAAAIERKHGDGAFRICQVRLAGMTINPAAKSFASRLLFQ